MTPHESAKRHFLDGLECVDREDYANAEKHFRIAHEILPGRLSVINNLTAALIKLNRLDEARQLAEESLKNDDSNALAWLNLGVCLQEARDFAHAVTAFRRALALDETLNDAWMGLGSASVELGETADAAEAWLALLKQLPRSARLHYSLSRLPKSMVSVDILSLIDQAVPDETESQEDFETFRAFAKAAALDKAGRHEEAWTYLTIANRRPALELSDDRRAAFEAQNAALATAKSLANTVSPADPAADDTPVSLFILGPSQSGKTTLERLIGALAGVRRGGESLIVGNAVSRTCETAGIAVTDSIADLPPALHASCRDHYLRALRALAGPAQVFTNTLPGQVYGALQVAAALPNARFAILRRDPDDLALRIFMKKYRIGNAHAYDIGGIRDHIDWYREITDILANRLPEISTVVHYEDMIADPQAVMRSVANLCDLEPQDVALPEVHGDVGCSGPYRAWIADAG